MDIPKRLYFYFNKLYFNYRIEYHQWSNTNDDDRQWHGYDEWSIGCGLGEKWFGREDWYYDGHTFKGITIFKIVFFRMYTYQAERMT